MVHKSLVQRTVHRFKRNLISSFLKDIFQSLCLFGTIRTDIQTVSPLQKVRERARYQIKILMENRLHGSFESKPCLRSSYGLMPEINPEKLQGTHRKLGPVNQFLGKIHQLRLLSFVGFQCLRRKSILMYRLNVFSYPKQVFHPQNRFLRYKIQKTNIRPFRSGQFGYNAHRLFFLFRQLRLDFKRTDAVNLIAEEVDSIRIFRCKGIDIQDTSS